MGCNMHAVVAYRKRGAWDAVMAFQEWRDYALFGALADVRTPDGIEPIASPRGLPSGFVTSSEPNDPEPYVWVSGKVWLGDHSYSWVNAEEFAEAIRRAETHVWPSGETGGLRDAEYLATLAFMRTLEERGCQDVALVFGFDN